MKTWRVSKATDTGRYIVMEPVGGQVICEIDPGPEAKKNAYRIAAVGELLAALKDIVAHTFVPDENCSCHIAPPCGGCVDNAQTRELLKQASAAIAKATGKDNA